MDTRAIKPEDNKGGTFTAQLSDSEVATAYITPVPTEAPGVITAEPGTVREEAIHYKTKDAGAGTISGLTRDYTNLNGGSGTQHENGEDWEVFQSAFYLANLVDILVEGFVYEQSTVAKVDADTFTVVGNVAILYSEGRILRCNQDNGEIVVVSSSSYSAGTGLTTVNITGTLPSTLSSIEFGIQPKTANYIASIQLPLSGLVYAATSGTGDAYTVTLSPAPDSYTTGMRILLKIDEANDGPCTLNVNSLGAKAIKVNVNQDPPAGALQVDSVALVVYDGTNFQLVSVKHQDGWVDLTDGATIDIDLSLGQKFKINPALGGNRTITLSNVIKGRVFVLDLPQDATGSRTITWPYGEEDFLVAAINTTNDTIDIGIDLPSGTKVQFTTDSVLPTGISAATDYYVVRQSATQIKIATSLANAKAGTTVDITAAGTGPHHMQIFPSWNGGAEPTLSTDGFAIDQIGFQVMSVNSSDSGSFLLRGVLSLSGVIGEE